MKKVFLLANLILICMVAFSQEPEKNEQIQTLFGNDKISISGFGAPLYEFSKLNTSLAVFNGGGGALLVNYKFFIGGYGMSIRNNFRKDLYSDLYLTTRSYTLNFNHGGFWLGYIHKSNDVVHLSASMKAGWGELSYVDSKLMNSERYDDNQKYSNQVYVLTPQVEAELNILRWFKVNIGVGYRYVGGINVKDEKGNAVYSTTQFNSPVVSLGLMFGRFGKKKPKQSEEKK